MLVGLTGAGAQDAAEPTAREEREAVAAEAAELASELDVALAEDEELEAALEATNLDVALKEERVAAARRAVQTAQAEVQTGEERIDLIRAILAELNDEALASVVDSYVEETTESLDILGNATTVDEVSTRRTLTNNVTRARADAVDELRAHEVELDDELRQHELAEADLARRSVVEQQELAKLVVAQRTQQRAADALDARIAEANIEMNALAGLIDELDDRIRSEDEEAERRAAEEAARRAEAAEEERRRAAEQAAAGDPPVVGSGILQWPVAAPRVTSEYGPRWGRLHAGIDIAAPTGTEIFAADSGTVVYAGWRGGYGNAVVLDHGDQFSTLYGHMTEIGVSEGETVDSGELIGWMGCTGSCTGPHTHFETRVNGVAADPRIYLP